MKWNWGTKIFLSFTVYVAFMGYLVYSSFQQNIDLVTEDYYGAELKYEQRINEMNNANALKNEVIVAQEGGQYVVKLPQQNIDKGEAHFYRPNDQRFDKFLVFEKNNSIASLDSADLMPGKFRVKVSWEKAGEKFYSEKVIFVK